jgi:hypothetical protein
MKLTKDDPHSYAVHSLRRWRVMEILTQKGTSSRHVYGHDITNDTACASTSIKEFNRETMTVTTHSGSVYKLLGAPGHSRKGMIVWKEWCNKYGVVSEVDVTDEYFSAENLFSKINEEFYAGLQELVASDFPKRCGNCGREYRNAAEFLAGTQPVRANASGLEQSQDDGGQMIVDLFRKCVCGATLFESFGNRRDLDEDGVKRRMRFQDMVDKLVAMGYAEETIRGELLKLMRGQPNDVISLAKLGNTENR